MCLASVSRAVGVGVCAVDCAQVVAALYGWVSRFESMPHQMVCRCDRCSPDSLASPSRSPPPSGAFLAICGVFLWCVSGLLHPPSHMWCAAPARPAWSAAWLLASLCLALSSLIDGMLRCAALRPTKRALLEEPPEQKASALSRCCVGRCARCARCPHRMHAISPCKLRIQISKYSCKYSCP